VLVKNDSTVPDTDVVVIVETDETNIVSMSNINSNLRENEEETSIIPTTDIGDIHKFKGPCI